MNAMKRFWQKEWHGIRFDSFATLSATRLAGSEFYSAFYRQLFRRYSGYEDLEAGWRSDKQDIADWLARRVRRGARVLSVGAGLGYVEHCLNSAQAGVFELHAQDFAGDALAWLRKELPDSRIHCTLEQQTRGGPYDLIYLSAVDYALDTEELVAMLEALRGQLRADGSAILISASFWEPPPLMRRVKEAAKDAVKSILGALGLYHRGQFWGWQRSQAEYRDLFVRAGYRTIADGFIQTRSQRIYYIEGKK